MMKWYTRIIVSALMASVVQSGVAQSRDEVSDATKRLMDAVKRSQAASRGINPQATTPNQQPAAAAAAADDGSELASLLQRQQTEEAKQREAQLAAIRAQAASRQSKSQERKPTIKQEAFVDMTNTAMPLRPDQIKTLKQLFTSSQQAAAEHTGVPPRPTSTSIMVNLAPGATPPIIRLSAGFVTSLVFVDATGAPWPISAWDLGDPRSFNIQWDKKGNTLMVQAITAYKTGNLAVILKDMHTPIMLTLLPGQKAVDYRVDLRMPGLGPNAQTFVTSLPTTEDSVVLNVLNGVPPSGAKRLAIRGGDAEAWSFGNRLYLRTRLTVLSPGWVATMSSADGLHAYELQQTPVILASFHGKLIKLIVEGL